MDKTTVKGKKGELKIYEVVSDQEDVTISSGLKKSPDPPTLQAHLTLQFHGQTLEAGKNRPCVTLGRYNQNDVIMKNHRVSRSHARIDYRRGKFVLTDQSLNGTFVHTQEGKGIFLKRDEMLLQGKGFISLGGKVERNSPGAILFAIEL
jgi:pSer/pThr/pTyr-binding forkhead associated (FHA) protein